MPDSDPDIDPATGRPIQPLLVPETEHAQAIPVQPAQPVPPVPLAPAPQPAPVVTTQPQYAAQPPVAYVAPAAVPVTAPDSATSARRDPDELIIVSHSPLVYWWPVWVVGYIMAGLTYWYGQATDVGGQTVRIHPDNNLGVLFFLTLFLVIVISNVNVRGYASGTIVMGIILVAVVLAYAGWWDDVLRWFGDLNVHLNQGAYFWFSTLMLIVWAVTTFITDRLSYWRVVPGQMTKVAVMGAASKSYDTENLMLEKQRNDIFRHWLLGLGSGDLRVVTHGAQHEEIFIPNVLFIGTKIETMQHMIAEQPTERGR